MCEEFKVSFSRLTRGKLIPILKAEKTERQFYGKKSNGIKVTLLDDELEIVKWLRKKLCDTLSDGDITRNNDTGSTDEKICVCVFKTLIAGISKLVLC